MVWAVARFRGRGADLAGARFAVRAPVDFFRPTFFFVFFFIAFANAASPSHRQDGKLLVSPDPHELPETAKTLIEARIIAKSAAFSDP
jgi:hypothetical protein